ncbi:MAG: class I SAM-dependent methyltransferase [Planctomycetes bacterium]|nr:class I SAM-dependent methyltransferase [Planctomycetota bacterium]
MHPDEALRAAFGAAAPEHFQWQTAHSYVSAREQALIQAAFSPSGARLLDLGCGEGATLHHLGDPPGAVGVDLFPAKAAFARGRLRRGRFAAASALQLPFREGVFDQVLVRDLVHHIPDPRRLVDECARVLRPGGVLDLLEPCGRNPLIALHALSKVEERGEWRSTVPFLHRLFSIRFEIVRTMRFQPLPIHRIVFHPEMGFPRAATIPAMAGAVDGVERAAAGLLPKAIWAYIHLRGVRR